MFSSGYEEQKGITPAANGANEQSGLSKTDPYEAAIEACKKSKTVIIVPGYGMALAQAQFMVLS